MRGFSDATPSKRGGGQKMSDVVEQVHWPEGDYESVRMVGPVYSIESIWFKIATERRPAPKGVSIPKMCLDHDGESDKHVTDICPYLKSGLGRAGKKYYVNVIVRSLQLDDRDRIRKFPTEHNFKPESRLGYKAFWGKKGDERKTPVRVLEIPDSMVARLIALKKLNKGKSEDGVVTTFELSDPKMGCDIQIMIDPTKKGAAAFDIQKGDRSPLSSDERRYIIYPLDLLKPDRLEEAKREIADLAPKIIQDEPRDGGRGGSDRGGSSRPARSAKPADDPLMEGDSVDFGESDLEDEPAPRRRSSRDEDERPARRREEPARKSRSREDEDEDLDADLDADLDGDDDEEEERPTRSASRDAPARRSREEPARRSRDDRESRRGYR